MVTVSAYTACEDFAGAALVVSSLGDPGGEHTRTLDAAAGIRPGDYVTLVDLDAVPASLPHFEHNKISESDWRTRIALRQQQIATRMLG